MACAARNRFVCRILALPGSIPRREATYFRKLLFLYAYSRAPREQINVLGQPYQNILAPIFD